LREASASRQAVLKQQQNGVSESCFFDVVVALLTALSKVNGGNNNQKKMGSV
jgi:hypothetical protein